MVKKVYKTLISASVLAIMLNGCTQSFAPQAIYRVPSNIQVRTSSYSGLYQAAQTLFTKTFSRKDLNRDGLLNIQEAGLDQQAFEELDTNKDKLLNQKEMFPPKMYEEFIEGIRELANEELSSYDKNSDAKLNYPEFRSYAKQHVVDTHTRFKRIDRNFDSHLNLDEFEDFVATLFTGNRNKGFKYINQLLNK